MNLRIAADGGQQKRIELGIVQCSIEQLIGDQFQKRIGSNWTVCKLHVGMLGGSFYSHKAFQYIDDV